MNRLLKSTPWLLLAALAVLPACGTEIGAVLYVTGNTLPEEEECLVQASGGGGNQSFISVGVMDLRLTDAYRVNLMVQNQAPQFEGLTGFQVQDGRLDGQMVTLKSAKIRLTAPRDALTDYVGIEGTDRTNAIFTQVAVDLGLFTLADPSNASDFDSLWRCDAVTGECESSYDVPTSAQIEVAAQGAVSFDLIPANYGQMLRHMSLFVDASGDGSLGTGTLEVVLSVTLHGTRHDGKSISSQTWTFPVTVCNGCLLEVSGLQSAQVEDPVNPVGADPVAPDDYIKTCFPGSDEKVYDVWCSFMYPVDDPDLGCQRTRCLEGTGQPSPAAGNADSSLYCPGDGGVVFSLTR